MPRLQRRNFSNPEHVRNFPCGSLKTISLDEVVVGNFLLEPGWRWSKDVKPIAGTPFCQNRHVGWVISGRLHVELPDGTTMEVGPGDAYEFPPGHDAWVLGDEPFVGMEFKSAAEYAES